MSQYLVTRVDYHTVEQYFTDSFDTTDQLKWDKLLKKAREIYDEYGDNDLAQFPLTAPAEHDIWLDLYEIIGTDVYETRENYWKSLDSGDFITTFYTADKTLNFIS